MEAEMKRMFVLCLGALAATACAPADPVETANRAAAVENELAETLRGRTAGPPVSCVNQRLLRGNRSVGEGAIVFEASNNLIYVNRPPAGCPELDSGRTLITRTTTSQLCRGDIVTVVDPVAGFSYGSCGLGDFQPYRRMR
jgi:hypothetical protein